MNCVILNLTLIWDGFLGVRFEVKLHPPPPPPALCHPPVSSERDFFSSVFSFCQIKGHY